jgi:hypothetical protein
VNDERDPLDETLGEGLRGLAPSEFALDADRTLGELRPRLRQARARRRLALSTSVLGALVVVVGGAALLRHDPSSRLDVQGRPRPTVSTLGPSTSVEHRATTTTAPSRSNTTVPGPVVTAPTTPPTTPATSPTSSPTSSPTTIVPPAPVTKTYSSAGGRITVRFAGGRLTLVSKSPAVGYTAEVHTQQPDDVEVRFRSADREWRVRVRVENGKLRPEIEEH